MIKFFFSLNQWMRFLISLAYLSLVVYLELMPASFVPEFRFPGTDKVIHACMYFGLTFLVCWTFHAEKNHYRVFLIVLIAVTWGILMEIVQFEMKYGRSFEWIDILSNSLGALMSAMLFYLFSKELRKSQRLKAKG